MSDTSHSETVGYVVEVDAVTGQVTQRPFTAEELADRDAMAQTPPVSVPPQ